MQLSKFSYYADFFIYPIVCSGWAAASVRGLAWVGVAEWFCTLAAGMLLWTLLEYILHRIVLHGATRFAPLHAEHHSSPLALIGTPTWISMLVLGGVIGIPAWACCGYSIASALTIGVMLGYWWYGIVHHVIHHGAHERSTVHFGELRAWHMRHHYSPKSGNFGVTTGLWDYVFRTAISARSKPIIST